MSSGKRLLILILTVLVLTGFSGCADNNAAPKLNSNPSDGAEPETNIEITAPEIPLGVATFVDEPDLNEYADEVLRLINIERQNAGLSDLKATDALTKTAVIRANELITLFSHTRPNGSKCFTAFDENKVAYAAAAENIASGQRTPQAAVTSWMNSAGHKANILNSKFGHVGVGVAADSDGKLYWSLNFTD